MTTNGPTDGTDERIHNRVVGTRRDFLRATVGAGAVAMGATTAIGSVAAQDAIATPWLHRDGNLLRDPEGNRVILRGLNIADPKRLNVTAQTRGKAAEHVVDLATDGAAGWYPRVIRVPVQPIDVGEHPPGHIAGPPEPPAFTRSELETYLETHLDPVVEQCGEAGVYCIVDFHRHWHDEGEYRNDWATNQGEINEPLQDEVEMFWDTVAPRYADRSHVLYEVYNEPTEPVLWGEPIWEAWQEMAQPWVDTIREHAPRNLILIGSPCWSQNPNGAVQYGEFDGDNLAYTYHIYSGHGVSHDEAWGEAGDQQGHTHGAHEEVPLFVTEFGWQGDHYGRFLSGTQEGFGEPFMEWLDANPIHWTAWCFDPIWRPVMFNRSFTDRDHHDAEDSLGNPYEDDLPVLCEDPPCGWDLLSDDGEFMGQFIKDALADRRADDVPTGGDGADTAPPTTPSNLTVPETTDTTVSLSWDESADIGDSGLAGYDVYVDDALERQLVADVTAVTIEGLETEVSYEIAVVAVDDAGNESSAATLSVTVGSGADDEPIDGLVVNDYDGDVSDSNDLGNWSGAGSFESVEVVDGALEATYDDGGWILEQIGQDITDYTELVFRIRGANGGEGDHFSVNVGGADPVFSSVADGEIATSFSDIAIDLEDAGVDRSSVGELRLDFWDGESGSSTIAIDRIHLE